MRFPVGPGASKSKNELSLKKSSARYRRMVVALARKSISRMLGPWQTTARFRKYPRMQFAGSDKSTLDSLVYEPD